MLTKKAALRPLFRSYLNRWIDEFSVEMWIASGNSAWMINVFSCRCSKDSSLFRSSKRIVEFPWWSILSKIVSPLNSHCQCVSLVFSTSLVFHLFYSSISLSTLLLALLERAVSSVGCKNLHFDGYIWGQKWNPKQLECCPKQEMWKYIIDA